MQLYLEAPQGKLGKPLRQLAAFAKTEELKPGETEELLLKTELTEYASYDDSGVTGHKSCYVLEEGDYIFYAGTDVRSAVEAGKATLTELRIVRDGDRKQWHRYRSLSDSETFLFRGKGSCHRKLGRCTFTNDRPGGAHSDRETDTE